MGRESTKGTTAELPLDGPEAKKKKGFRVGPDNLPDGPWRRKVDKVKKNLIRKAKVKQAYAKVKAREEEHLAPEPHLMGPREGHDGSTAAMHPDRQAMLDGGGSMPSEGTTRERRPPPKAPLPDAEPDAPAAPTTDETVSTSNHTLSPSEPTTRDTAAAQEDTTMEVDGEREESKQQDHHHQQRRHNKRPGYFDKQLAEAESKRAAAEAREKEFERRRQERAVRMAERKRFGRLAQKANRPGANGQRKLGRESELLLEKVKRMVAQQ